MILDCELYLLILQDLFFCGYIIATIFQHPRMSLTRLWFMYIEVALCYRFRWNYICGKK